MYIVSRSSDQKYGNVIAILRAETGELSPFAVVEEAKREKRLWLQEGTASRFIVDRQVLTAKDLDSWAREEYKSLPKCLECAAILHGEVFSNALSEGPSFCSESCATRNYHYQAEHLNDYEEFDL